MKKYRIDGDPVTASELINSAAVINGRFAEGWLKETSVAANILRAAGHVVDHNPAAAKAKEDAA